jgi:hypothetical protein
VQKSGTLTGCNPLGIARIGFFPVLEIGSFSQEIKMTVPDTPRLSCLEARAPGPD